METPTCEPTNFILASETLAIRIWSADLVKKAAKVAAKTIIAELEKGEQPSPYKGNGICYVEFGDGRVGKVNVDFFSGPSPFGSYTEATADLVADKQEFGSSREARWFGK